MQKLLNGGVVICSRPRGSRRTLRKSLLASVSFIAAGVVGLHGTAHAEDVDITTSTNTGVNLDTFIGSTARVFPGVTVDNTVIFNGTGISATTQVWTLTNQGIVTGGNSISFTQGGAVTNSAGAQINAGLSGIVLSTFNAGGAGSVDNFGTITANVEGVTLKNGGTVTNYLGGTISTTGGNNAVSVGQGASRTVVNSGEIHADKTTGYSTGVLVQGGAATLTNNSTGIITGGYNGIYASASALLTFTNNGSITSVRGPAVEARGGGIFTNTGTIQSGNDGMFVAGANPAAVNNSGTIGSTGTGRSIAFSGASAHTLNLLTGSALTGNVQGGTGTDNLVLQGTGTESIAKFLAFETLSMQGADWTLTGTGTFNTSTAVTSGVLRVNGQLTSPTVTVAAGGTLGGTLGGSGTVVGSGLTNSGVLEGTGGGTLALNIAIANGGTIRANGGNVNANTGFTGTGTASTSGTGVLTLGANSAAGILLNNGSSANALNLGMYNITVSADYDNANFGTGNSFNRRANVTGGGLILAAGDVSQAITGAVTGGTTASPVLSFGNVRVGDNVSQNYQIANTGTTGPVLRGAIQTAANGGSITDSRLSGLGVTAGNFNPIATGSNSVDQVVTFNAASAGALTGQAVHIKSNFDNIQNQTLHIQGAAFNIAAGHSSSPIQVPNQRVGGSNLASLTVANTAAAGAFSEDLNAGFGANTGAATNNGGAVNALLAGASNAAAMKVGVNTASGGAKTGSVTLNYQSTGTVNGVSNGLGVSGAGSHTISVNGNVYQAATGAILSTALNFGTVQVGQVVTQNMVIANTAAGVAGFVEDLNASFGTTTGVGAGLISGIGALNGILAGTNSNAGNGSMTVSVNTTAANVVNGSIAVNYFTAGAVNGVSNDLGTASAGSEAYGVAGTIQAQANVINQASPLINNPSIHLGAARVGDASPTAIVSVTNVATAAPQAALNASISSNGAPVTAGGSFNLLAPGGTNSSALQVGLATAGAGNFTGGNAGSATLAFVSDADNVGNCAPNCQLTLASQQVSVSGKVYTQAIGQLATTTLDFGVVRVGDTVSARNIVVNNTAAVTALNDTLRANLSGVSGPFTGGGSAGGIGAQAGAAIAVGLNTASAGVYNQAGSVAFLSQNPDLADISAGANGSVQVKAQINNLANADFDILAGLGLLTQSGSNYLLNLGNIVLGNSILTSLRLDNDVAGPADDLSGLFDLLTNADDFSCTGWGEVTGLAAGQATGNLDIGFLASTVGLFEGVIDFKYVSTNAADPSGRALSRRLVISANVIDQSGGTVPEPGTIHLLVLAAAAAFVARRRRAKVH
ncbi:beta strand repeat-containing protein [Rhodoferax sp.]|uniref:beta strand repeat-containing protein n=1 Tax=Rhodoferax sp. TaxID=50421 RepID=UPI00274356E7|nr:choice-of-anchor D domain-containing protein [Rhodoferax sp.]